MSDTYSYYMKENNKTVTKVTLCFPEGVFNNKIRKGLDKSVCTTTNIKEFEK